MLLGNRFGCGLVKRYTQANAEQKICKLMTIGGCFPLYIHSKFEQTNYELKYNQRILLVLKYIRN